jgi:transcriptional regulator with XRE-family HTH domain
MISKKKSKERPSLLEELKETQIKIGARIKQLRTEKRISQETFANQNGLDRTQVSRIERGVSNLELHTLVSFLRALDISLKDFFAGID